MRTQIRPLSAVAVLTTLTILSVVVAVTFLLWDLRKRELEHSRLEAMSLSHMLIEQTEQAFDATDLVLRGVQERLQSSYGSQLQLDSLPVHLLLNARVSGMRQLSSLFIVDADGNVTASSRGQLISAISVADREYYKAFAGAKHSDLFIGRPVRNHVDGAWTLHLARRLDGPGDKFRGVVVAAVSLQHFEQLYDYMKLDFARPIALYLADGTLVASLPHRENAIGDRDPELGAGIKSLREGDVRTFTHVSGDGAQQVFAMGRVRTFPLLVGVYNDEEEALSSWRETAVPIILSALLMSVFIIAVALLLAYKLLREAALARALREADDRYQRTIDSVMDAIVATDDAQNILMFNPAAERMFGLSAHEAIGSPLERLIPAHLRNRHQQHITEFIGSGTHSRPMAPQIEITGLRTDGSQFPIDSTISQMQIDGKMQFTAVLRDVTERRRAEAELREMNLQLRGLSAALQNVREQERTRIARELHDELGQQLTGLKLDLSWLSSRLKEGRPTAPEQVDAMRHLLDAAIAAVRRISVELRPLILDDLGFGEALAWQTGEFAKRCGIEIALDLPAAALVKDDALATALFRIVQESLTNIARHASATRVEVCLIANKENIVLTVRDNGKGFTAGGRQSGIGLVSMRERATALGGYFSIISSIGMGTTIEVTLPLNQLAPAGGDT